jgi:MFS family permease
LLKHTRDIAFLSGIVYFCQGALGISGIALLLFLRKLNWSVTEITTISSIAAAPWVLKIFYGLLSDFFPLFGYRRKSYLIIFSIFSGLGWLLLVSLPSEKMWILSALLMTNLGFAATDVITDGLIVEHSTHFTSHIYQSIAWGARSLGSIFSGITGGWLAAHWVPRDIFLLTMVLPVTVTIVALWIHEKKIEGSPFASAWMPVKRCFELIVTTNIKWFAAILVMTSISATIPTPFFFHLKETLGFSETFLGFLASLGWSGALVGSFIYARLLRNVPIKKTLRWAIILNSINILMTLFIFDKNSAFILVLIGGVIGCLTMLPIMSSAATLTHHTGVEGTLFAVLMSIYNLGQIAFGFLGGKIFELIGLQPLIVLTGICAFAGVFMVSRLSFSDSQEKLQ